MTRRRSGMTLLELVLATTVMTTLVVAVGVALRTGHLAWEAQQDDAAAMISANATVRHIVRRVRQAQQVSAISKPDKKDGTLSLLMPSGETFVWARDKHTDEVYFGVGSADALLSQRITELHFTGYAADGVTEVDRHKPADIHSVECEVVFRWPPETGSEHTVSCRGWLRSW